MAVQTSVVAEAAATAHAVVDLGGWQSAAAAAARGRRGLGDGYTTRDGYGRHCPAQYPATVR